MNKRSKVLIIIIPGSRSKLPFKDRLSKLYNFFGINRSDDNWPLKFQNFIKKKRKTAVVFEWSRGISRIFSINPAVKRLTKYLKEIEKNYGKIVLYGKSMGGIIAEQAIKNLINLNLDAKKFKLIYVATPHKNSKINLPSKVKIINIYSEQDRFLTVANKLLYGKGSKNIEKARNILLSGANHTDFNCNKKIIIHKNKKIKLFEFYFELIDSLTI